MKLSDEYRLSQYKDLDILAGNASVHLVRNEATGMICVQKRTAIDRIAVYEYLRSMSVPGIPHIYECIEDGDSLVIVEEYINGRTIEEMSGCGWPFLRRNVRLRSLQNFAIY